MFLLCHASHQATYDFKVELAEEHGDIANEYANYFEVQQILYDDSIELPEASVLLLDKIYRRLIMTALCLHF